MATPGTTKALSLTFGVEIELLMPWLFVDQKDPHEHIEGLPPVFRVERARVKRNVYGTGNPVHAVAEIIFHDLRDTLEGLGLASSLTESYLQDDGYSAAVLESYQDWEIEDDGSLNQQESLGYEENFPSYGPIQQWVSLEIQSPAEYATPEAFMAINGLQGGTVNQRGSPSNPDEAASLRAGLVTSPPQRDSSYRHESARTRACPKMALPRYTATELQELVGRLQRRTGFRVYSAIPARAQEDIGVFEGVRQIFDAPSSCCVSKLLSDGEARGSINFNNYNCRAINSTIQEKRTVEFRMGEGCLDDWVGTWAAICVGFVRFAMYAPIEEYLNVLTRCDLAAKQDGSYDVLDLLDDLCLFEEAEIAEKRVLQHSKDWDVKFVG
ncbi:hypothetical protein DL770_004223 [Monosporascus sp. CRB-9-2]|nr:hypothetical protein DL770_004223 [Monosporascus sp. CRB-9-2]